MKKVEGVKDEVTEAQELLQKKNQEKLEAFMQEYNELSKKHGFGLSPVLTIKAGGIEPNLEVVAV
jgi:hypothetical protein